MLKFYIILRVDDLIIENGETKGVITNYGEKIYMRIKL